MKPRFTYFLLFATAAMLLATSCIAHKDERQLKETANGFADAYFNWQLSKAEKYCTPTSAKWIRYMASQLTQEDIDALRQSQASTTHQLRHIAFAPGDTMATVSIRVENLMALDSIEQKAHMVDKADYELAMTYRHQQWKVMLSAVPRPQREAN